jgi:hypothetical protein
MNFLKRFLSAALAENTPPLEPVRTEPEIRPFVAKLIECVRVGDYKNVHSSFSLLGYSTGFRFALSNDLECTVWVQYSFNSVQTMYRDVDHLYLGAEKTPLAKSEGAELARAFNAAERDKERREAEASSKRAKDIMDAIASYTPVAHTDSDRRNVEIAELEKMYRKQNSGKKKTKTE